MSNTRLNLATAVCLGLLSCTPTPEMPVVDLELPAEIAMTMERQQVAWNSGSIGDFMAEAYWEDEALMFIGSRGITYGYAPVLENYLQAYPDGAARGVLAFENLEWRPLGAEFGFLVGKWSLDREAPLEDLSGHYSLVWRRFPSGWRIVADHSS